MESKIKSQVTERFENIESNVGKLKLKSNDTHLTIKEVQIEQRAITRELDRNNVLLQQLLQQLRTAPITGQ